jgi:membrane protease YdiL (CAAX protease family)
VGAVMLSAAMPLLPAALLLAALAAVAWLSWQDARQYAAFKTFTDTAERQRVYRRWLVGSVLLFIVGSLAALSLVGQLGALTTEPPGFLDLTRRLRAVLPLSAIDPEALGGFVGGLTIGMVALVVIAQRRGVAGVQFGDFAALMPRNGPETLWALALSLNAGVSEELFFRLLLPLLFVLVAGKALIAFAAASVVFGFAHLYQGWLGILATGLVGAVFAALYLWSGNLIVPMALHAAIDVLGLVIRPTLARWLARR